MKFKIILIALLAVFLSNILAQNEHSYQIKWTGVENWNAGSGTTKFITFTGARYPDENRLPYFREKIPCDSAAWYKAELVNLKFGPISADESELIGEINFDSQISIKNSPVNEDGKSSIEIELLPFIKKEGKILKLLSFDVELKKVKVLQKAPATIINSYAQSSVLAQGKFVKIRISDSGIYKLTYEDLSSMGIDPANVRIFGYGGGVLEQNFNYTKIDDLPENAIWMSKGADGVFNAGDYILFYAQGVTKWTYTAPIFTHKINSYSKYGYYFVTSDAGTGKRIEEVTESIPNSATINKVEEFNDYQVHENETINLIQSGKEFYGETFNDVISYNFAFNFPNIVSTNSTVARLDVAASSSSVSSFSLSLNGTQTQTLSVGAKANSENYTFANSATGTYKFTPAASNLTYNVTFIKQASSATGYLNYLEVNARRQLKMSGSAMQFQNTDYLATGSFNQYLLSDANSNIQIWDITDQQNISKMATQVVDGKMTFTASGSTVKNYLAIDPTAVSSFPTPTILGVVPNQNIHAISQADLVILTHPDFLSQAQTLAQAHRVKDNLTVEVVTTDQVYNEFSSGTPDATAYRWIMKMLYDRASTTTDKPKYLLLFGRGSYDNRKLFTYSGDNLILTYQADNSLVTTSSYVTDDYFGILKDNQGSNITSDSLKLGIGRLPVSTTQQATNVVNKIISYMNNSVKGNWKNQLCYLADDGDQALHMRQADSVASIVERNFPEYQVNKIYLDAYQQVVTASGESYPLAKSQFLNLLNSSGLFLLDYTGHAGALGWANEGILTSADVKNLTNTQLPLFVGATCDFLQFDIQTVSAGEQVVLNPNGGGIGILSAARPVYAEQNSVLNRYFCGNLFKKKNNEQMRLGDVLAMSKNNVGSESNKLSYIFMGDPALKLTYPTQYKVQTIQINQSTILGNDTLKALSVDTIQGIIVDNNGNKVPTFNGSVHAVIYDKSQRITTLNNEKDGTLTYSYRPNTLFSGKADVVNGEFKFSFMLPKDIKYNYGGGRINYYAEDDTNNNEAQGYFENFIIGGTDKNYISETVGPDVQLFLNSENFVSGDKVNETPVFIANMSDINGINTVGSGIGHDLLLKIDQDPAQSYVLNNYYQAKANSYIEGSVEYKLPELTTGKHTLTFRVWDLLNNSTAKTINFEVVKGLAPTIFNVYNYPNPVKSSTKIVVEHDRPETVLSTTVEIFDIAGRKIWSFGQSSADKITWDLTTNDGHKVKTGVYFYRVNIKTANSDICSKTNKMLIIEQ